MKPELVSIAFLQSELRRKGEFDAACILDDVQQALSEDRANKGERNDTRFRAAMQRLVREAGYSIPFMFEDAVGNNMVALEKLTPEKQALELERMRAYDLPGNASNIEKALHMIHSTAAAKLVAKEAKELESDVLLRKIEEHWDNELLREEDFEELRAALRKERAKAAIDLELQVAQVTALQQSLTQVTNFAEEQKALVKQLQGRDL